MAFSADEVKAACMGRYPEIYGQFAPDLKPLGSELRDRCPIHHGNGRNFAVNPGTGLWRCFSDCQHGGDVFRFFELLEDLLFPEAVARVAALVGFSDATPTRTETRPTLKPAVVPPAPVRYLDKAVADKLHRNLMANNKVCRWLSEHRGLTAETLQRFQIGLLLPAAEGEEWRVCFPVFDRQGRLTNIRKHLFSYKPDLTNERRKELGKTKPWELGLRADLYPLSALDNATEALIVEGEADAVLACQMGLAAITGTGGAGTWHERWTEDLAGLSRVTLLYDADQPGQEGAKKAAASICRVVPDVRIACYPISQIGGLS